MEQNRQNSVYLKPRRASHGFCGSGSGGGMSEYIIYFRASGEICGREDFQADDDVTAIRMARVLYDTCSDVSDCFELWQGPRQILNEHQSHHQKVCLTDLIEAHQGIVLDKEEALITRQRRSPH
jgi:hypothetical protein